MKDYELAEQELTALAGELGLVPIWRFVPLSQSRNADEEHPTINWRYELMKHGRKVVSGDYMQGCTHAPAYKVPYLGERNAALHAQDIRKECETGRTWRIRYSMGANLIPPSLPDLLSGIASDAGAIDYASYEDWATDYGFGEDSRSGEAIYRTCLETALKLRAALGEETLSKFRNIAARM